MIDVSLINLEFRSNGHRLNGTGLSSPRFIALPDDPDAGHPDAEIVPDHAALYSELKKLFDSSCDIVIPSLHRAARASMKVSWNAVAASCAQVFFWLYALTDDTEKVVRHAEKFFGDPISTMHGQARMEFIGQHGKKGFLPDARAVACFGGSEITTSIVLVVFCYPMKNKPTSLKS